MKTRSLFILILIIHITACTPQNAATSAPVPSLTHRPPTLPPLPATQPPEPTPVSLSISEIELDACREIVAAGISSADELEIIFTGQAPSSSTIYSRFGFPDDTGHTSLATWSTTTQATVPFPLPAGALGPKISTTQRWILYRQDSGENQSELWVTDIQGQNAKRLVTLRYDEIATRYAADLAAQTASLSLAYEWIPNTDTFLYAVEVLYGELTSIVYDQYVLVEVASGRASPLNDAAEIEEVRISPDGLQMSVQMEAELRVLSTQTGQVQFTQPIQLNDFTYSPDGQYLLDFIDEGILRLNAETGQQQLIPLQYTVLSSQVEPSRYGPSPDFLWADNSTLLLTSLDSDQRYVSRIPFLSAPNPDWTFTVWQIDLANGTTRPLQTFSGDPSTARLSPDRELIAFHRYTVTAESQAQDLHLADLATGEILTTIKDGTFKAWFPDSRTYLYVTGMPHPSPGKGDPGGSVTALQYYLGHVAGDAILVNWDATVSQWSAEQWVDEKRLVMNCKIITFPSLDLKR